MSLFLAATTAILGVACATDRTDPIASAPFVRIATYSTGVHPVALAVADLDSDGDTDIAVPGLGTAVLTVLENLGDSEFALSVQDLPAGATDIDAVDLSGDGIPELIVTMQFAGQIAVLERTPANDYAVTSTIDLTEAQHAAVADVDGDGHSDLVVTRYAERDVVVLIGDGNGGFSESERIATAAGPYELALLDLDGEAPLEVVVTAAGADSVAVHFLGGAPAMHEVSGVGDWPSSVHAVEIDGDPGLELIGAANLSGTVYAVDVDATAPANSRARIIAEGDGALDVAAADFDGDGLTDLAVSHKFADEIGLLRGAGGGEFVAEPPIPVGGGPSPLRAVDITGDGILDLVVVDAFSDDVTVLEGTGLRPDR